jgi:hypothetical protein
MDSGHTDSPALVDSSLFPQKYQFLREINAFKDPYRIHQEIVTENPIDAFISAVKEQFAAAFPDAERPNAETLRHLYERGIDAAVDRMWIRRLQHTKRSKEWKTHKHWVPRIVKLSKTFESELKSSNGDLLPESELKRVKSIAQALRKLREQFLDIQRFDERLPQIACTRNWNSSLRSARTGMNKTLVKACPGLNNTHRAELIRLATEYTGLKDAETEEAVSRRLRRARRPK